ncbi:MAG: hypothetical protein AAF557_13645 [Pseudomonadota bacterium]
MIQNRRREVTDELSRIDQQKAKLEKELADLETAERVIASLTGATGVASGEADAARSQKASGAKPKGIPTMPEMIGEALLELEKQPSFEVMGGVEPKDVKEWIATNYWPDVNGDSIASVMWRLAKEQRIFKTGSLYHLVQVEEETPETGPAKDGSEASLFPQPDAKGREAGPGGGT